MVRIFLNLLLIFMVGLCGCKGASNEVKKKESKSDISTSKKESSNILMVFAKPETESFQGKGMYFTLDETGRKEEILKVNNFVYAIVNSENRLSENGLIVYSEPTNGFNSKLWLYDIKNEEKILVSTGVITFPAISRKGENIAYTSYSRLKVVSVDKKETRDVTDSITGIIGVYDNWNLGRFYGEDKLILKEIHESKKKSLKLAMFSMKEHKFDKITLEKKLYGSYNFSQDKNNMIIYTQNGLYVFDMNKKQMSKSYCPFEDNNNINFAKFQSDNKTIVFGARQKENMGIWEINIEDDSKRQIFKGEVLVLDILPNNNILFEQDKSVYIYDRDMSKKIELDKVTEEHMAKVKRIMGEYFQYIGWFYR